MAVLQQVIFTVDNMRKETNVLVLNSESLESLAARESQLDEFVWYEFRGKRKRTVQHRNHTRDITPGTVYGLRPIRGGDYYLILPDMYHVDFRVKANIADNMVKQSSKKRTKPKMNNLREGRQRAQRAGRNIDRGSNRFKPLKRVKATDEKNQVDLSNYQWRKLTDAQFKYNKTQKISFNIKKNQEFGCRFINANKGGIIVFDDGTRFRIPTVQFDELMEASRVLTADKWRTHTLSESDLEKIEQDREREKKRELMKQREERKQLRIQRDIKKRQEANKLKEKKRKENEARRQRILDLKERSPKAPVSFTPVIRKDRVDNLADSLQDEDNLIDNINKIADTAPDLDLEDLDVSRVAREDTEIDENEIVIADADQDAVEDALDKEIDEVSEERNSSMFADDDDEDDVDFEDDDEADEEEDLEEIEEDDPDLEDINAEEEQEEALDSAEADEEYEDIDEELDETDEVDEDAEEGTEESDDDDGDSEESSPEDDEEETEETFEEGFVIQFKEDETEQREFLILDIYPLKNNDRIQVYKVYDIGADDETYQTVRIDTKKKATIEKMATFVRKMNPKEFTKYYNAMEGYEKSNEPITS